MISDRKYTADRKEKERHRNMDYGQFITEIQKYWDLREKGLKKQANKFLFAFTKHVKEHVSEPEADAILFQFCREYLDEMKFPSDHLPRRHLPFQMTELLNDYLIRECEKNKMPQMRWAFQIFGRYYNPHDPKNEHNPYHILERAYAHEECDQQTVDLYFGEQIEFLWWGQHHFPEGCIITKEAFHDTVCTVKRILAEKKVDPESVAEFEYYVKLYQVYFEWHEGGRKGSFHERCEEEGIDFNEIPVIYYEK